MEIIKSSRAILVAAVCLAWLLSYPGLCCYKRLVYHGAIPLLYIDDCTSNYDLGLLVGSTFSSTIKGRMRDSLAFQKVQAYCNTNWGRQLVASLKDLHRFVFPAYYAELQGLAAGAGVPFDQIFMLNLRQEILAAGESPDVRQSFLQRLQAGAGRQHSSDSAELERDEDGGSSRSDAGRSGGEAGGASAHASSGSATSGGVGGLGDGEHIDPLSVDACSDVAVRLRGPEDDIPRILLGHNEDMTNDTLGRMYYIRVTMPGRGSWFALTYAGELASTAFGANTAGVAFTLNALYPRDALLPGLGRNFLSRRLLDATSVDDALEVLAMDDQATGRSVNLMSTRRPLGLWNVEVGPGGAQNILELHDNEWYFHANAYIRLPQRQQVDNSSVHREARAAQFPMPMTSGDVLAVLGDTADEEFPIFRTGDYGGLVYTLCTALYDLVGRRLMVYRGNPRNGLLGSVLSLDTLMPVGPIGAGEQEGQVTLEGDLKDGALGQSEVDDPWVIDLGDREGDAAAAAAAGRGALTARGSRARVGRGRIG